MKVVYIILILISMSCSFISAIVISPNFGDASTNISDTHIEVIPSDSLVLQVSTSVSKLCRYSKTPWAPFHDMTNFEDNFEIIHKKPLTELTDGIHRYFVRCTEWSPDEVLPLTDIAELEIVFRINAPIAADIIIEDAAQDIMGNDVLKAGKYKVSLITTKRPSATPSLSYSYDGISYKPIIIDSSGDSSGNFWKGYLVIPKSAGEKIGTFKFEATALEGGGGTKIRSGSIFSIDTTAPTSISNVEAIGEYKRIRLEWFSPEDDIKSINIYRSITPGVSRADLYKTIDADNQYYSDNDVSKLKTYYYRISPVDEASNVADLSPEVSAMTRRDNNTVATGLSSELVSLVDAMLTELKLLDDDINNAQSILDDKSDSEKELLRTLGISGSISSSLSELNALEREITNYKLQNLNSDVLNSRLSSSRIKLNIIKKKVPSQILTIDSSRKEIKITDDDLRTALIEYSTELTPSQIDKSIKQSFKMMEENNLEIVSEITVFETVYLDGSKSSKTIIKHFINSVLERGSDKYLLLKLPSAISSDYIKIKNLDYTEEKYGLFSFGTDVKVITYILDDKTDVQVLNQIILSPVKISQDSNMLTGYFLSEIPNSGSLGMTLLVLMVCSLVIYLTVMKKKQQQYSIASFLQKARKVKGLQSKGSHDEANSLYNSLQLDYASLTEDEKSKVFNKISHLHKK
ncbi:hypothetical protein KAS08_04315 [Candidatus Pacearchaeota archaeon]|nr:hypothetical protein [Candidatus Pacearchaeota archaeon]